MFRIDCEEFDIRWRAGERRCEQTRALKTRARELERMGLAREVKRNVLAFSPDWREQLQAMELHLDIRKRVVLERTLQKHAELERAMKQLTRGLLGR